MSRKITRRTFLHRSAAAAAVTPIAGRVRSSAAAEDSPPTTIGKLETKASAAIEASRLSIGFETLDRKMFAPKRPLPHLAELGVKWARCQTGWCRCEPEKGRYEFGWLDDVVDSLLEIGIQPWLSLSYGNKLYTSDAPTSVAVGWAPIFDDQAQAAWLRFTEAIGRHFADRVRHWEIWNEPNGRIFWQPRKADPADYARMVRITAPALREQIDGAFIIGGALAGIPLDYLKGCLQHGMAEHVDAVSYHPYRTPPEKNYEAEVAAMRKLLAGTGRDIKLWQGENGCPSKQMTGTWSYVRQPWTETIQAKWLTRRILSDLRLEVDLTSYFHTVDLLNYNWGQGGSGHDQFMGVLRGKDYTRKPSYFAYQSLCTLLDAQTQRDRRLDGQLQAAAPDDALSPGFARKGAPLCAYWRPTDLFEPPAEQSVTLRLPLREGVALEQAVLVDPLSQEVCAVAPTNQDATAVTISNLPLRDYPMIVTDRSALTVERVAEQDS
jgi:hypothetical protein